MADAKFANREKWLAKIAGVADVIRPIAEQSLDVGTDDLVGALQRAAPLDNGEHDPHPGALKASVHKYAAGPLIFRIIADARDRAGRMYGRWVEFGHGAAGPRPWWFPTYRAWKKPFRTKLYADVRRGLKAWWDQG